MSDQPDRVAALRAQLLDELARIDAHIHLAEARSRNGADPLAAIAAQEGRQVRGRILGLLNQLDQADGDQFPAAGPDPALPEFTDADRAHAALEFDPEPHSPWEWAARLWEPDPWDRPQSPDPWDRPRPQPDR